MFWCIFRVFFFSCLKFPWSLAKLAVLAAKSFCRWGISMNKNNVYQRIVYSWEKYIFLLMKQRSHLITQSALDPHRKKLYIFVSGYSNTRMHEIKNQFHSILVEKNIFVSYFSTTVVYRTWLFLATSTVLLVMHGTWRKKFSSVLYRHRTFFITSLLLWCMVLRNYCSVLC